MKPKFLLPPAFKWIGIVLLIPGFVLGYLAMYWDYQIPYFGISTKHVTIFASGYDNLTNELALGLVLLGLYFTGFSRLKTESNETGSIRLRAIYWAVRFNLLLFTLCMALYRTFEVFFDNLFARYQHSLFHKEIPYNIVIYYVFSGLLIYSLRFYYIFNRSANGPESFKFLQWPVNIGAKILMSIAIIGVLISPFIKQIEDISFDFLLLIPPSFLLMICSKEKNEDAFSLNLRLHSIYTAVFMNLVIVFLANWILYGLNFLLALYLNLTFTPLLFVFLFYIRLYKARRIERKSLLFPPIV